MITRIPKENDEGGKEEMGHALRGTKRRELERAPPIELYGCLHLYGCRPLSTPDIIAFVSLLSLIVPLYNTI